MARLTIFHFASILVWVLLVAGYFKRSKSVTHAKMMATAITFDLALVIAIEIHAHAIKTAVGPVRGESIAMLLGFHILVSISVVCGYFVLLGLGFQLLRGRTKWRTAHRRLGITVLVLRTVNLVTSFVIS